MLLSLLAAWLVAIQSTLVLAYLPDYDPGLTPTDSNVSPGMPLELEARYADRFQSGNVDAWPKKTGGHRLIRYCFATEEMRQKAFCNFQKGMDIWSNALGGPGSAQNGHSLAFHETTDSNKKYALCYSDFDTAKLDGKWNDIVPRDTLAIFFKEERRLTATVGYITSDREDRPGRHYMVLCDAEDQTPYLIAHEIGHVMGMIHEHQRTDRDDFVEYRPTQVKNFAMALLRAMADGNKQDDAKKKLTEDNRFARKYGFPTDFIKGDGFTGIPLDGPSGFDYDSIMMYATWSQAANHWACMSDLKQCPLVKIKKENGVKVREERMEINKVPSAKDVEFVRKYCPWDN